MCDCKTCKIHKKAIKEGGCCAWYMDNVIIAGKSVKECSKYKVKGLKNMFINKERY